MKLRLGRKRAKGGGQNQTPALDRQHLFMLGLLVLGAVLPIYPELPLPVSLYLTVLIGLQLASCHRPHLNPGRMMLFLFTLLGVWLIFNRYHTLIGYQAGIALFALMLGLKLLEIKRPRDLYLSVFLALLFLVIQFLLDQSMYLAIYSLLVVTGLFALLVRINRVSRLTLSADLRLVGSLLLQSLPLMLILFLLFPRLSAPLWDLRIGAGSGVTGLSEHMQPGSINQLISSNEVAFRAEFSGPVPTPGQRYWRGPILWHTDGQRWQQRQAHSAAAPAKPLHKQGEPIDYTLILEPHGKRWVLALDLPTNAPRGTRLSRDYQLISEQAITQKKHYRLQSHLIYDTGPLDDRDRTAALQLPGNISPRMRGLVKDWQGQAKQPQQLVELALAFFNREQFLYTLRPPLLGEGGMDRFLFETRAGFCEHYSAAFTLLMRLAGIPARVVTGYLGGEFNELGEYLIVRQSSAHAWSEVWLAGQGWVRVDPTAAIAPERIINDILFDDAGLGSPISFRISDQGIFGNLVRGIRLSLDAVNMRWHTWVLGYGETRRNDLLHTLGLGFLDRLGVGLLMGLSCLGLLLILGLSLVRKTPSHADPVQVAYGRFCRRLGKIGLQRLSHEGPIDFAQRAGSARPDLEDAIQRITKHYIRIRYSGRGSEEDRRQLKRWVREFRPGKARGNH